MNALAEMLQKGGIMMYPLLVTSVIGLAVFIERALYLRRRRIIRVDILNTVDQIREPEPARPAVPPGAAPADDEVPFEATLEPHALIPGRVAQR